MFGATVSRSIDLLASYIPSNCMQQMLIMQPFVCLYVCLSVCLPNTYMYILACNSETQISRWSKNNAKMTHIMHVHVSV